jgi:hypothetical protein
MVGSYSSTKWLWMNLTVKADLPTPAHRKPQSAPDPSELRPRKTRIREGNERGDTDHRHRRGRACIRVRTGTVAAEGRDGNQRLEGHGRPAGCNSTLTVDMATEDGGGGVVSGIALGCSCFLIYEPHSRPSFHPNHCAGTRITISQKHHYICYFQGGKVEKYRKRYGLNGAAGERGTDPRKRAIKGPSRKRRLPYKCVRYGPSTKE